MNTLRDSEKDPRSPAEVLQSVDFGSHVKALSQAAICILSSDNRCTGRIRRKKDTRRQEILCMFSANKEEDGT